MWLIATIKAQKSIEARASWTRDQVLAHQKERLSALLHHAWHHSPFYRDYYSAHGLKENHLGEVSETDLPIINKEILMENFDQLFEDPLLNRAALEAWIHSPSEEILYQGRYVVVHTSGTSGAMGLYVSGKHDWSQMKGVASARAGITFRLNPFKRNRMAFVGATHGRFAGVTSMTTAPKMIVDQRLCSVLEPLSKTIETLNEFQPEHLFGYPSAIHELAEQAIAGTLSITPKYVFTAGEIQTKETAAVVKSAWNKIPINGYGASESPCIGYDQDGSGIVLNEDEHIIEILNEEDSAVAPEKKGRTILTNLYNYTIPILRYDMRDYVTRGHREANAPFETITSVDGRVNDALPIRGQDGADDSIHPLVLSEFFVPGLKKFQFIGHDREHITINYVAETELGTEVEQSFQRILELKDASERTRVEALRKSELPVDSKTGKYRLITIESPS